ncbi:MAG TPA: DinB family protein [Thermoanaerobaculia bacterium]|nr:DinB family protein [Thermoanaerobaculia bacterium]
MLAYVQSLLDRLGERDPMVVQAETVPAIRRVVQGMSADALHRPERPGKWSVAAVVRHLADNEWVHGWRYRRILTEEQPEISGYDQDVWSARFGYDGAEFAESLALFDTLRRANLRLLAALGPEELARTGRHAERGEESVERMRRLLAAHDLVHLEQIARIRTAVAAQESLPKT